VETVYIENLTIWDIARLAGFSEPTIAAAQAEKNIKDDDK
jgi:hypothetical protein